MNISLRRITNKNINKLRGCSPCKSSIVIGSYLRTLNGLSSIITIGDLVSGIYDNGSTKCRNFHEQSLRNLSVFDNRHL